MEFSGIERPLISKVPFIRSKLIVGDLGVPSMLYFSIMCSRSSAEGDLFFVRLANIRTHFQSQLKIILVQLIYCKLREVSRSVICKLFYYRLKTLINYNILSKLKLNCM